MENSPTEKPAKPQRGAWWLALLSLLVALSAVGAGVYLWKQNLESQMQASKKILGVQTTLLQTQTALLRQKIVLATTQQDLQHVMKASEWRTQDWVFAEVNYLIQRAVFFLTFEKNVGLARELLLTADKRLQTLATPAILPLREALNADMVGLAAAPMVDVPGILLRVNALSLQVEQLPRLSAPEKQIVNTVEVNPPATWSLGTLKNLGLQIAAGLKGLVAIHYDAPNAVPLLPPDQYVYVITNIQAQLSLTEWAALHRQAGVYQSSLTQAILWIQRYFPPDNAAVKGLVAELENLRTQNINPALPDLSRSISAMHALWSKTSP